MSKRDLPIIGIHPDCGGTVRIKDWETHDMWRYEAWCNKCLSCDPNGYGSVNETVREAARYFGIERHRRNGGMG